MKEMDQAQNLYDLIVIGGGPAGVAAGVYAARKKLKAMLITESFGGQSLVADSIENWIGEVSISGIELAQKLEKHLRAQEEIKIKMPARAVAVSQAGSEFLVKTDTDELFQTRSLVITTGGRRRRLKVVGEDKFEGRGISFCATCDAPLFKGKTVAVVGGGNAGAEAVIDLAPHAQKIYWLIRDEAPADDPITQEHIEKLGNQVEIIARSNTTGILGEQLVTGLEYQDLQTGEIKKLELSGVFVEIGSVPNSEMVKGLVELNDHGEIIVDHKTGATSQPGIFAAGDVTDEIYKQNNIAVGNAVAAALSAYHYLLNLKKQTPAAG